jgi:acetyl esterase/lipase
MSAKKVGFVLAGLFLCVSSAGAIWLLWPRQETSGLVYHTPPDGDPLTLDIDYPLDGKGPFPVLVYIPHDGTWHPDFKQEGQIRAVVETFTEAGYAVATIHYRSPFKTQFPGPIQDSKAAVRWLRANAAQYRLNPDRIGVMGGSAGGYGACMVGTTGPEDGFDPPGEPADVSCRVQAVVALAAPTDLTRKTWPDLVERSLLKPFLGAGFKENPAAYRKASPGTYATPDDPPFLLIHSPTDPVANISHPRAFADQLKRAGVDVVLTELPTWEKGHVPQEAELKEGIIQLAVPFLDKRLKQ